MQKQQGLETTLPSMLKPTSREAMNALRFASSFQFCSVKYFGALHKAVQIRVIFFFKWFSLTCIQSNQQWSTFDGAATGFAECDHFWRISKQCFPAAAAFRWNFCKQLAMPLNKCNSRRPTPPLRQTLTSPSRNQ